MRTSTPAFRSPRAARLSPLAAGIALALAPAAGIAATYQVTDVTSTSGTDPGTLYDIINQVNAACLSDANPVITFISGGPFTLKPSQGLPSFDLPAFSCPFGTFNPEIDGGGVVDGASAQGFDDEITLSGLGGFASCGLDFPSNFTYGGKLTVRGMKIENFTYGSLSAGVCGVMELHNNLLTQNSVGARVDYNSSPDSSVLGDSASGGNVVTSNDYGFYIYDKALVENNKIGTPDGTNARGNTYGVWRQYSNGAVNIDNNLISGNTSAGVYLYADYGGTVIDSNYIGTTADGDSALPNGDGIYAIYSGSGTITGNTISGNNGAGIYITDSSDFTIDSLNAIGLGFSSGPLGNGTGISTYCANGLTIDGNNIFHNGGDGLLLYGTDGSTISNNSFDNNSGNGVRITSGTTCFQYGSFNSFDGNEIQSNGSNGILMTGFGTGNTIGQNHIVLNANKNISLNGGGATLPNDVGDTDSGPNNQQNWPVLSSVLQNIGSTSITFSVDSDPASMYLVNFYSNPSLGKPAGDNYLGGMTVYGGASATFTYFGGAVDNVSGTATNQSTGDTSEFSPMKAAVTAPTVVISPTARDFGNVVINNSSPTTTFLLRSIGDQPYMIDSMLPGGFCALDKSKAKEIAKANAFTISPPCYGGAFICSTTCQADFEYTTGTSCSVSARFAPTFTGFQTDSICIFDNTADSPHFIDLAGTGILPPPLAIDPPAFDFGSVPVGASSDPMRFRVTNQLPYGAIPVTVGTIGGEFTVVSEDCTPSIPPLATCNVDVTFDPTTSGDQLGQVAVVGALLGDAAKNVKGFTLTPPQVSATLQGTGVSGGQLNLPSAIDIGAAQVGGAAISFNLQLKNTGYGALSLSSITLTSPFTLVNPCPASLAPGESCIVTLQFAATSLGEVTGSLTVVSSAEGGSKVIPVTARGQTVSSPLIRVQPTAMGFGSRIIGSSSATQQVTITNIGGAQANIDLSLTSIDFLISGSTCGAALAPQASCNANIGFRPLGFGPRTGAFTVTGNQSNGPVSVSVGGTGCRPFAAGSSRLGSSSSCAP